MSETTACPYCDSTSIKRNCVGDSPDRPGNASDDPDAWRCIECGRGFDDPKSREREHETETRKGLAGRLARAEPDDVEATE